MKEFLRKYIGALIAFGFIVTGKRQRALRYIDKHRCVICICAHNPTQRLMSNVILWFQQQGFCFVSQADMLEALAGQRDLPRRAIWLVLDDGWKGILNNVIPLLRHHGIPATIAISPAETENEIAWPTLIMNEGKSRGLTFPALFDLPNAKRLEACEKLRSEIGNRAEKPLLSVNQVRELAREPLITIENHTNTHARCTRCTVAEFQDEIMTANRKLEDWTGRKPAMLFYPFGAWSGELDAMLPACGISSSANSGNCFLDLDTHASSFAIPRIALLDDISLAEATCRLLKAWIR